MEQGLPVHFVTGTWGDKYRDDYVTALKSQVPGLICLGRDRPLRTSFEYWWIKAEVFAPWNEDIRPLVWFDLDTYVFDATPFQRLEIDKLHLIDDFNSPQFGETGIMAVPKDTDAIWDAIQTAKIDYYAPDGQFLRNFSHIRLNHVIPGIYSYKLHCRDRIPQDACVCCFHGKPKPHETEGWGREYWLRMLR